MEISAEDLKSAIKKPDRIMEYQKSDYIAVFYIKRIKGKGELLVMAKKSNYKEYEVECFGWTQHVLYPA